MKSWETTLPGAVVIATGFGLILMDKTVEGLAAITSGVGLILARSQRQHEKDKRGR